MPGKTNIDGQPPFKLDAPPEKLDIPLPPGIDPGKRNYDKGWKRIFGKKLEQELKKQDNA